MSESAKTIAELRERFTLPVSGVAAAFAVPVSSMRKLLARGDVRLQGMRFSAGATAPTLYDPVEVEAAAAAFAALLVGQLEAPEVR